MKLVAMLCFYDESTYKENRREYSHVPAMYLCLPFPISLVAIMSNKGKT